MSSYLRPKYFLLGVALGFAICSMAGYFISTKARLHNFSRFFNAIQPEALYYPTAEELLVTARHDVSRDKILVLVGGSSVFRGAGQGSDELWSDELQKLLGNKFKVLNYASDSASLSSFGGVIFRVLKNEYSKIIFIAPIFPFDSGGDIDGLEPYSYLFWDAYYKKLFKSDEKEAKIIKETIKNQIMTGSGAEKHLSGFLNSLFYFKNLWNWVGYRLVFTVWSNHQFQNPFRPRRFDHDQPIPADYKKLLSQVNHDKEHLTNYTTLIKHIVKQHNSLFPNNPSYVNDSKIVSGRLLFDKIFQPQERSRILFVHTVYNPAVISMVPKDFQQNYWFITKQSHAVIEQLGYHVLDVGKTFADKDYVDISHFSPSGGKKLAAQVAKKVKFIAAMNGYY